MTSFTLLGRAVTHTARPRFRVVFSPRDDGSGAWDSGPVEWLDGPPPVPTDERQATAAAKFFAKLMRESGDYFFAHMYDDWIQELVIDRSAKLGINAYQIAIATGWAVSDDHVQAYLTHKKSMGSHKLQHVLRVLGLEITVTK